MAQRLRVSCEFSFGRSSLRAIIQSVRCRSGAIRFSPFPAHLRQRNNAIETAILERSSLAFWPNLGRSPSPKMTGTGMTTDHCSSDDESPTETWRRNPKIPMSRRVILQLASGAVSMAVVPRAEAEVVSSPTISTARVRLVVNGEAACSSSIRGSRCSMCCAKRWISPAPRRAATRAPAAPAPILLDGRRIVSCLTLAVMHDGAEITTIEGLAKGEELHPLQAAFIEHEGFQCGYCTPGQIMSGVGCIAEGHAGSPEEIQLLDERQHLPLRRLSRHRRRGRRRGQGGPDHASLRLAEGRQRRRTPSPPQRPAGATSPAARR